MNDASSATVSATLRSSFESPVISMPSIRHSFVLPVPGSFSRPV
jgi:hypothetical protein